jgi:hypothetical protein
MISACIAEVETSFFVFDLPESDLNLVKEFDN